MALTPEYFISKAPDSESAHQIALFCWAGHPETRTIYPELRWMHAIPNGGLRSAVTASRLKMEGVRAGVADIHLPASRGAFCGLYIEMKAPGKESKTGKNPVQGASEDQLEFRDFVESQGYVWHICYSFEQAKQVIINYLEERDG